MTHKNYPEMKNYQILRKMRDKRCTIGDDNIPPTCQSTSMEECVKMKKDYAYNFRDRGIGRLDVNKGFESGAKTSDENKLYTTSHSYHRLTEISKGDNVTNPRCNNHAMPLPLVSKVTSSQSHPISYLSRSLHRTFSILLFIVCIGNLYSYTEASLFEQSKCETYGWNAYPVWKYRARARFVAPMKMDADMQDEFLKLFRGGDRRSESSEEDSEEDFYFPELHRVAEMCPRDAFFYSLSPMHLEAAAILQRMFVAQANPPELHKLAKALLHNRHVNPKVWYFGLIGAAQERPDMTGFKLAHPVDAMPDIFIPGPLIYNAIEHYRSDRKDNEIQNGTTLNIYSRVKRSSNLKKLMKSMNEKIVDTFGKIDIGSISSNMSMSTGKGKNENESRGFSKHKSPKAKKDSRRKTKRKAVKKKKNKVKKSTTHKIREEEEMPEIFKRNATKYTPEGKSRSDADDLFDDCIVVDGSVGIRNGLENKMWYFREDMQVNQHHWYWHQEYPLNASMQRPRRAELFFYMHHNLIARYDADRLSNGLARVEAFDIRPGAPIATGYDSQLVDVNSGKYWTPRPPGVQLSDIVHEADPDFQRNIFLDEYNDLYGKLIRSIKVGHLLVKGVKTIPIRHSGGIEPLSNTIEATGLSVNPMFYNEMGLHNLGHQIIGLSTDPYYHTKTPTGVMADTATTMRDPEFYSYHAFVDNLFDKYKQTLPPYKLKGGDYPLRWDGVEILDVKIQSKNPGPLNQLRTFWSHRRFELTPGVDQSIHKGDVDVDVCAVHLDHEPFDFKITVTLDPCAKTKSNRGTMRIYLAPRFDEWGNRIPLYIQRRLMIHMDSFPVDLRVGRNVIYRRSYDSSAVKPWSSTLKDYEHAPENPKAADFCGCGWPTHLYIPKGSKGGMQFDVFVMITNFDDDYVENDAPYIPEACNSPYLYCGIPWRNYPDSKPMGYPFDRLPYNIPISCGGGKSFIPTLFCKIVQLFWSKTPSLEEYAASAPNMHASVVEIKHFDQLVW